MTNPNISAFTFSVNVLNSTAENAGDLENMNFSMAENYFSQQENLKIFLLFLLIQVCFFFYHGTE